MDSKAKELVETINAIARDSEQAAKQLRDLAQQIEVSQDVGLASEAAIVLSNLMGNLKLDKLIRLPYESAERKYLEASMARRE